jgi:hypothetical protein
MGSGNGYWTYMLRQVPHDCSVIAVDSGQSTWRTLWISDTVVGDGVQWLRKRYQQQNSDGKADDLLLMVYPVTAGTFTQDILKAFQGDVICIAGTQNGNGYTSFKDVVIDVWFETNMPGWEKVVQVPLPSFPGKDDALFVFRRKKN